MVSSLTTLALLGPLGIQELLILLLIVVVIFGASKIPQLGTGLGEGIRNFKQSFKPDEPKIESGDEADEKTP